ncbi:MAG: site-specific integrase [Rhodocyclaceae bacterium]|nr:site-specific integrase [Rhodocyclaceae bacterium]
MINLSDELLIVDNAQLDQKIRLAISSSLAHLRDRYGPAPTKVTWDSKHAAQYYFCEDLVKPGALFGSDFLEACLGFNQMTSRNERAKEFFSAMEEYFSSSRPAATAIVSIKQCVKLTLVELWSKDVVLLPSVFDVGSYFRPIKIERELLDFVFRYKTDTVSEKNLARPLRPETRRMWEYMPRVLMSASWRRVEDFRIQEFADLHRAQRLYIAGKGDIPISTSPIPWTLFLNELLEEFPNRIDYDRQLLVDYSYWSHGGRIAELSFEQYCSNKKRPKTSQRVSAQRIRPHKPSSSDRFLSMGQSATHESALTYFTSYRQKARHGIDWLCSGYSYLGREHIKLAESADVWATAFRAFLHHRATVKGYEQADECVAAMNTLADYLFLYLPWWKELFPNSKANLPFAPKNFLRHQFVYRSVEAPLSELPETLLEIIKLRRPSRTSQYAVLKQLQFFFSFVEAHFAEDEIVGGREFRSPIFKEFDLPRFSHRGKTSKIVFPRESYGYLVHYGYAVEAFGEFLLEACLGGSFSDLHLRKLASSRLIDTAEFGFMPYVLFRRKLIPLRQVPNVFSWARRYIKSKDCSRPYKLLPHLTTLRVFIVAIETGLRLSSVVWLDQRTWDANNPGDTSSSAFSFRPKGKYVSCLQVSSDKTKEKAWDTYVVFRVRAALLREQEFQHLIDEPHMDEEVPYRDRPQSRFGRIRPLFRSATSAKPVSEESYHDDWTLFMVGFQVFFEEVDGTLVSFVRMQPTSSTKAEPKILRDFQGAAYCPVSTLSISTPHACRASFATHRQGFLETTEIAELIGHTDPSVTEYYQSPRAVDLESKLEKCDRAIYEHHRRFDQDDAAYVRADNEQSSLVRIFRADRTRAEASFGFMPPVTLWGLEDSEKIDQKSIEELRNGPMSLVRFRETHICPVGEECPTEIVESVGGYKRCGLCPLAMKCIDHLPAIAAKKHSLVERIRYLFRQKAQLEARAEFNAVEAIWQEMELDTNELLGWQLSEEVLTKLYSLQIEEGCDERTYLAEQPEVVRRHLLRVVKQTPPTEFLLQRLAESNAYPSLQSPQVQAVAANIRRRLLAGVEVSDFQEESAGPQDVSAAAALLKTLMQANQLSVEEVANRLSDRSVSLPTSAPLRIGGAS